MSGRSLCEASAMDAAHFGNWDAPPDWCPPCEDSAEVERHGYHLCRGCARALELLEDVSLRCRDEARRRAWAADARRERLLLAALIVVPFAAGLAGWLSR